MRIAVLAGISFLTLAGLYAEVDPPSRVARLNYLSGDVSFQPAGVDDWVNAPLNRPLTTGDRIWSDDRGRVELHIGSTAIRAASQTGFSFLNLDDNIVQLQLSQGSLQIRLRRLDDNETFEVDTPNLAFSLLRPGMYRIDVNPDGQSTIITVRGGDGEGTGGGQAFPVHVRQQVRVTGTDAVTYDFQDAPALDSWDNWCATRDRREEGSQSVKYVSREVIGYEDLDENGTWRPAPGYGMVWYPRAVAAGWAPYRYGHWAWVEPWGWTWVDDAPWGFAPFHYGRWVYVGGGWAWVPGPIAPRPVYAPALVAFVGGAHFSISVSAGGGGAGVAWFPLGPGEVYIPAHHASPRYFNQVNTSNTVINNNVNITRIYNTTVVNNTTVINNNTTNITYVNRNSPGAVTAVPRDAFVHSRPVAQAAVAVPASTLQSAQVSGSSEVAPSRQSVLGANAGAAPSARPPASVLSRPVVAKAAPPPRPVPFAMRQEGLQANPGRPLTPEAAQQLQQRNAASLRPMIRQAPPVKPNAVMVQPGTPHAGPPAGGGPAMVPPKAAEQKRAEDATRLPQNHEAVAKPQPEVIQHPPQGATPRLAPPPHAEVKVTPEKPKPQPKAKKPEPKNEKEKREPEK